MSPAGIFKKAFNKLSLIRKTLLFRFEMIHLFNQDWAIQCVIQDSIQPIDTLPFKSFNWLVRLKNKWN